MTHTIRVAAVQMDPKLADVAGNLARCVELLSTAVGAGAQLVVFPEAALSGYVFGSLEEAIPVAEPIPGPSTDAMAEACRRLDAHAVVGLLEKDGDDYYNASALIGPDGLIGKYRKLHLPYLGVDRFLRPGNLAPKVHETRLGRIGLSICYDLDFPEYPRVLALMGAQILVTATNWPDDIEFVPDHIVQTRARENVDEPYRGQPGRRRARGQVHRTEQDSGSHGRHLGRGQALRRGLDPGRHRSVCGGPEAQGRDTRGAGGGHAQGQAA